MNKRMDFGSFTTTSSGSYGYALSDHTVTAGAPKPNAPDIIVAAHTSKPEVENAVYAHIRALRSLGRTSVNTAEIARALSLPLGDVALAVKALNSKGVKVAA